MNPSPPAFGYALTSNIEIYTITFVGDGSYGW